MVQLLIMKKAIVLFLFITLASTQIHAQKNILPGAYQTAQYFSLLKNKRVGLFTNQTAMIGNIHLIDTLIKEGIQIQKVFTPEHGLRGTADAGEKVSDEIDAKTGIKIVSLYGKKMPPIAPTYWILMFYYLMCRMWGPAFIPILIHFNILWKQGWQTINH